MNVSRQYELDNTDYHFISIAYCTLWTRFIYVWWSYLLLWWKRETWYSFERLMASGSRLVATMSRWIDVNKSWLCIYISAETWSWVQVSFSNDNRPPILIDPTVTIVSQENKSTLMFVFGGYTTPNYSMSRSIYVYDFGKWWIRWWSQRERIPNIDCNRYWALGESTEEKQHRLCWSPRDLPSRHWINLLFWWFTRKQEQWDIRISHLEWSLVPKSATAEVSGTTTRSIRVITTGEYEPSIVIWRTSSGWHVGQ